MKWARKPAYKAVWVAFVLAVCASTTLGATLPGAAATLPRDLVSWPPDRPVDGPVTVRARVTLPAGTEDTTFQAAVLAGLGDAPGEFPSALSLLWAEDRSGWFPTWSLQLHSDRGLLPESAALRTQGAFGTQFVTLGSVVPQWGHEYEAVLSLEPALSSLSVWIKDLTGGAVVYRGSFDLLPSSISLYPSAGRLHKGESASPVRFTPAPSLEAFPRFIPAGVEWAFAETLNDEVRPVPLASVDRDRVEAVLLRLDAPRSAGTYSFFAESEGMRTELGHVERPTGVSLLPIPLESLPVGAFSIAMEYRENGRLLLTDSQDVSVGRIDAGFGAIEAGGPGEGLAVSLTLRGDGAFPPVRATVQAELVELLWDESAKAYVERPHGRLTLADTMVTLSANPHVMEFSLPDLAGEDGVWKVRFDVRTGVDVPVRLEGETAVVNLSRAGLSQGELKAMSFNLRRPTGDDGANAWQFREDLVYRVIRELDPDVVGFQEPWEFQLWALDQALPEYDSIVVQVHPQGLVHNAIYYRPDRLELLDEGRFWLSDTPETWRTPSGERPRAVVWGLFRAIDTGHRFYVVNTHYRDGKDAAGDRIRSSRIIEEFVSTLEAGVPVVLMGDFNAAPGSEEYRLLTAGEPPAFFDARERAALVSGPEGTHHGFTGRVSGIRIDWVLLRGHVQPLELHHVTLHDGDRYPSDHLPVYAVLRLL